MNKKIPPVFLASCRINLFSIIIFVSAFIYHNVYEVEEPGKDLYIVFLAIVTFIYAANYYLGIELLRHFTDMRKPKKAARIIFYSLEIILFFGYSFMVYFVTPTLKLSNFLPVNIYNALKIIALVAFFAAYFSSLLRIILTWPLFKMVKNQNIYQLDNIGEKVS